MLIHATRHVFSEICICGHRAGAHHGNCIMNVETAKNMESHVYLGECEHYGVNEGWEPCPMCPGSYIDKDDPFREEKLKDMIDPQYIEQWRKTLNKMIKKGILRKEKMWDMLHDTKNYLIMRKAMDQILSDAQEARAARKHMSDMVVEREAWEKKIGELKGRIAQLEEGQNVENCEDFGCIGDRSSL
jgi:hypothetical protein